MEKNNVRSLARSLEELLEKRKRDFEIMKEEWKVLVLEKDENKIKNFHYTLLHLYYDVDFIYGGRSAVRVHDESDFLSQVESLIDEIDEVDIKARWINLAFFFDNKSLQRQSKTLKI